MNPSGYGTSTRCRRCGKLVPITTLVDVFKDNICPRCEKMASIEGIGCAVCFILLPVSAFGAVALKPVFFWYCLWAACVVVYVRSVGLTARWKYAIWVCTAVLMLPMPRHLYVAGIIFDSMLPFVCLWLDPNCVNKNRQEFATFRSSERDSEPEGDKPPRAVSVRAFLAAGADVNASDVNGRTALIAAASGCDAESVKALIAAGADVNAEDTYYGTTALMEAARKGVPDSVRALIAAGADVHYIRGHGNSVLGSALESGNAECIRALIEAGAYLSGLLVHAASGGRVKEVLALISCGVNVNESWSDGTTALMKAAFDGDVTCVNALLNAGAEVNVRDGRGKTALGYASSGRIAKMLKAAGGTD